MDYCYVVQPSQLLLSVILVKTKRNIGFAPPVLAFQTRMEILPVWRGRGGGGRETGTPIRFLRQMLNSLNLNRRINMSHTC